jgi:tetratricopeptide (TPR) repeat protein
MIWIFFLGSGLGFVLNESLQSEVKTALYKPVLPSLEGKALHAELSQKLFLEAKSFFLKSHKTALLRAAELFFQSVQADPDNIPALSMLAMVNIDLLEVSVKNENTFFVIKRLLELIRAHHVDLPEKILAEAHYLFFTHAFDLALNRVVEFTKTHLDYGSEMMLMVAKIFFAQQRFDQALFFADKISASDPLAAEAFWLQARAYEEQKNFVKAKDFFEKALSLNPDLKKAWVGIASCLVAQNAWSQAFLIAENLKKQMDFLFPQQAAYLWGLLAQIYQENHDVSQALYSVEQALRLQPDNLSFALLNCRYQMLLAGETPSLLVAEKMYSQILEAQKNAQQGKTHEAIVNLLEASTQNPQNPLAYVFLGDLFFQSMDMENARFNFEKAVLLFSRPKEKKRAWLSYLDVLLKSYDWPAFEKAFEDYKKFFPDHNQSILDMIQGNFYAAQGFFKEAHVFFRKAIQAENPDVLAYLAYAKSLAFFQQHNEAQFFFSLALAQKPGDPLIVNSLAQSLADAVSLDEAIAYLDHAIFSYPFEKKSYLCKMALLYLQKADSKKAQSVLDRVFLEDKGFSFAWKVQAKIALQDENKDPLSYKKALSAYEKAYEINMADPEVLIERYRLYLKLADYENARQNLMQIYQYYPRYPQLHFFLASLYYLQGNLIEALKEMQEELKNNPQSVLAMIGMGKIFLDQKDPLHALEQFASAIRLDPENVEARQSAGWAHYLLKEYSAAVTLMQSAIEKDQANPVLYRRLALIYREMGDRANACRSFQDYLKMEPDAKDRNAFDGFCQ